jgi:hypothetical protein
MDHLTTDQPDRLLQTRCFEVSFNSMSIKSLNSGLADEIGCGQQGEAWNCWSTKTTTIANSPRLHISAKYRA